MEVADKVRHRPVTLDGDVHASRVCRHQGDCAIDRTAAERRLRTEPRPCEERRARQNDVSVGVVCRRVTQRSEVRLDSLLEDDALRCIAQNEVADGQLVGVETPVEAGVHDTRGVRLDGVHA